MVAFLVPQPIFTGELFVCEIFHLVLPLLVFAMFSSHFLNSKMD